MDQGLKLKIPTGQSAASGQTYNSGRWLASGDGKPHWDSMRQGNLSEPKQDLGESEALSSDEVNMPELDVTLHGCKGGPVMGIPREPLVCSPRVSSLGTTGDPLEVTSVRSVAEGKSSGDNKVHEDEQESANPSETGADAGAVEDLSSVGEEKLWAPPPRNLNEEGPRPRPLRHGHDHDPDSNHYRYYCNYSTLKLFEHRRHGPRSQG